MTEIIGSPQTDPTPSPPEPRATDPASTNPATIEPATTDPPTIEPAATDPPGDGGTAQKARRVNPARRLARTVTDPLLRTQRLDNWVLLRSGVGALVMFWGLTLLPDLADLYGSSSIVPSQGPRAGQFSVFRWWTGDIAVGVVLGLAVLGGLAMALGVAVRLAAPVAFVAVTSLMASAPLMLNGGDDVLRLLLLFIALYAVIAPADGLNTAVGRLGLSEPPTGPPWGLVVIRIQIIAMYIVTVLDKMEGSTWLGGTATIRALNLQSMRRFWVPEFMLTSSAAHNLMTWGTLAPEVAIPILLINRRTRRWGIVLGVGFHAALGYVLRLGLFPATVTIAYLAFLTPAEASAIVGWVRRGADRIVGLRAKVPSPGTDQADDP